MHVRVPDTSTILVPSTHRFRYDAGCAVVVVAGATVRSCHLYGSRHHGDLRTVPDCRRHRIFCWLIFTLAVFALPFAGGLYAGLWAFHTGAGVIGALIVGIMTGIAAFAVGQIALACAPWIWLRGLIVLLYTVPAVIASYSATHGLAQMMMPSAVWQLFFSVIGATAVGITAFVRFTGMAPPEPAGGSIARV
ncbi:hypothetical protein EDC15_11617 [Acetobacter aceti NBRC 14818]|nr:hypothetical protein EDC15_11617 [Acetobacter aceti NBRC 14818]